MSGMKNHFDNYMDMILSGGESNDDDSSSVLDDFDDVEEDEKLNVCREIFSAKYDLEDDEASNDSWRYKYDGDIDCDIDPYDYDTEEEYLEALEEAEPNNNISTIGSISAIKIDKNSKTTYDNTKIYSYCKVLIESYNKQSLYLSGDLSLNVGDQVIVPYGRDNAKIAGTVVAVGKCFSCIFPYDINDMKTVVKLLKKQDSITESAVPLKEISNDPNLVYEDNDIKISFVKWSRDNYWIGGIARTGTFVFENKTDKRTCIYMKDISVCGFLNVAESATTTLAANQKAMNSIPFVYENKIPSTVNGYKSIEFKVCYGTIREGFSSISFIDKPVRESRIISINV